MVISWRNSWFVFYKNPLVNWGDAPMLWTKSFASKTSKAVNLLVFPPKKKQVADAVFLPETGNLPRKLLKRIFKAKFSWFEELLHRKLTLIFQFPIYLEPSSQLPIYQVTIDPWFQIYRELEDEGNTTPENQWLEDEQISCWTSN